MISSANTPSTPTPDAAGVNPYMSLLRSVSLIRGGFLFLRCPR